MRLGPAGLVVTAWLLAAAPADARQAFGPAGPDVSSVLDRDAWTATVLASCRDLAAAEGEADRAFAAAMPGEGASREQASFLAREAVARRVSRANARRGALAHLTTLLFAFKARAAVVNGGDGEAMAAIVEALLATADPCAIQAVESTLLAAVFGLPFSDATAAGLLADGPFDVADAQLHRLAAEGVSVDEAFVRLRPDDDALALAHVAGVLREAAAGSADTAPRARRDRERRLLQVLEFLPLVFEPLRLRFYLHAKVDEVEGTFGVTLPDAVDEHLFQSVEGQHFASLAAMRRLSDTPPRDTLAAVAPLLDRWFRRTALPGLARGLGRDPHAAYAFFVASGGVVAPGRVGGGFATTVAHPAFALEDLRRMGLPEALATVARRRVPAPVAAAFTRIEATAADLTLDPAEVEAALTARWRSPAFQARLRKVLLTDGASGARVSTLDAIRPVVVDASRTRGRVDRAAVRAAIDVVAALKARDVARLVASELDALPDPAAAEYLPTAAALMLERERRQVVDSAFRESTSGAAVGFLLRRFMGGTLPVSLASPGGVAGDEFAEFVDTLTPKNADSGRDYRGRQARRVTLVHDGREYHDALVEVIDSARHFLNVSAFDWKTDSGGREIAYRLMAKTLGIDGAGYAAFEDVFAAGLAYDPGGERIALYDLPTTRLKDLLLWHFFMTSAHPEVAAARDKARQAGATLACTAVRTCGDLQGLVLDTPEPDVRARQAFQAIESLFTARPPALADVRPRRALRDYGQDGDGLRRFVRRVGLRRADRPDTTFPIAIVADGKQNVFNIRWGEPSEIFPYVVTEPVRDIYFSLAEFGIRVVLWKAPIEFPWNVGAVPWPGRRVGGRLPMPFVPWPWIASVPGFGWAGVTTSLGLQWLIASDIRMWWASVNHTKSWSNESRALESGMGMASKYFNAYETHKTWHDMGVLVEGPIVADVNDHFVQVFNQARVNNGGLAASRGTPIARLRYEDFRAVDAPAPAEAASRTWLLTTHPENGDANYRGVFAAALAAARRNIYVENSFFSDPLVARLLMHKAREFRARVQCDGLDGLACAARRRAAVQIYLVLPDTSDKPIVDAVGAADFFQMLDLGIKVHRWNPRAGWSAARMLHSKVWLVDYQPGGGGLAYVGAANATQRSHLADNEAGILSTDAAFVQDVYERIFVRDLTRDSRRESGENFRVERAANGIVAGSRLLRRLLVELLWLI